MCHVRKQYKCQYKIKEVPVLVFIPCNSINEARLKKQVSMRQQAVTDKVLIVAHCHTVAHAQRAQHLQHLEQNLSISDPAAAALKHDLKKITAAEAKIVYACAEETDHQNIYLVVASMLVKEWDDGLNVSFFNNVDNFGAFHKCTLQNLQDTCAIQDTLKLEEIFVSSGFDQQ